MPGKINVYSLGEKGLNLVKSPLHLEDGELTQAQNAEYYRDRGRGGIRKRPGLERFNSSPLGTIRRFLNVPLPATPTTTIFAANDGNNVQTWGKTTNGTAWTAATAPPMALRSTKRNGTNFTGYPWRQIASLDGRIYYPANDYTKGSQDPPIVFYDGENYGDVVAVPPNPSTAAGYCECVEHLTTLNGTIYLTTDDGLSAGAQQCGRVLQFDPRSGQLTQIGTAFGDGTGDTDPGDPGRRPFSLAWGLGRLWVGMINDSGSTSPARIYSIRPGVDENWTLEQTFATNEVVVTSMREFRGALYASIFAGGAVQARVYKRDLTGGAWASTETQGTVASGYKGYNGLIVFEDALYVGYVNAGDSVALIRKYDGSAWATELDAATYYGSAGLIGCSLVAGGDLYFNGNPGSVLRKAAGGGAMAEVFDWTGIVGIAHGGLGYTIL